MTSAFVNTIKLATSQEKNELLLQRLQASGSDIVICQEASISTDREKHYASWLAQHMEMELVFSKTSRGHTNYDGVIKESHVGLAVLSKYRVLNAFDYELRGGGDEGIQIAQFVILKVQGQQVLIINANLSKHPSIRFKQLRNLLQHPVVREPFYMVILGGEFDSTIDDQIIKNYLQDKRYMFVDFSEEHEDIDSTTIEYDDNFLLVSEQFKSTYVGSIGVGKLDFPEEELGKVVGI